MIDPNTRFEILDLLDLYIAAIDEDRLEDWPNYFVEDCLYEILPKENFDAGLPIPLLRCDSRRMLRDRVVSLRNANIFRPVIYRHFISCVRLTPDEDSSVELRANYLVTNTSPAGETSVFQTGRYLDRVVMTQDGWKFQSKRAIYDTSRVQTLLAVPI